MTERASPFVRGSVAESQMGAVFVEVADILGKKSAQVALVGGDDMIEQFAATP